MTPQDDGIENNQTPPEKLNESPGVEKRDPKFWETAHQLGKTFDSDRERAQKRKTLIGLIDDMIFNPALSPLPRKYEMRVTLLLVHPKDWYALRKDLMQSDTFLSPVDERYQETDGYHKKVRTIFGVRVVLSDDVLPGKPEAILTLV